MTVTPPEDSELLDEGYSMDWMLAHWAVASAREYGIQTVELDSRMWDRDAAEWTDSSAGDVAEDAVRIGFDRDWDED